MKRRFLGLATLAAVCAGACSSDSNKGNEVFFVGYIYDGATGARLSKPVVTKVSITYADQTIAVDIGDDGRFISRQPLPTWRDYTVKIDATGYRAFASYNVGIDVPASLAMTNGVAQAATTQVLDFAAYLFPVDLKSPKLTLTITKPDTVTGAPVSDKVGGQIRLRPTAVPSILIGGAPASIAAKRVWSNGEDLLTQTIVKMFTNGAVVVDEGEMVYGVAYEVTIFGVEGHQPLVVPATGQGGIMTQNVPLIAGTVTSQTYALSPEIQDPLRIVTIDNMNCVPPLPTANTFGAKITLTFNAEIEVTNANLAEDIDNNFQITVPSTSSGSCTLKPPTGEPGQERGSKVEVSGNTMTFSFNPSIGIATTSQFGSICTPPPGITGITYYQGTPAISVQPKGNSIRKRTLSTMISEKLQTSVLACPHRTF